MTLSPCALNATVVTAPCARVGITTGAMAGRVAVLAKCPFQNPDFLKPSIRLSGFETEARSAYALGKLTEYLGRSFIEELGDCVSVVGAIHSWESPTRRSTHPQSRNS
jgi:hypothetical protein